MAFLPFAGIPIRMPFLGFLLAADAYKVPLSGYVTGNIAATRIGVK
jgi:hypothetical protein